MYGRAIATGDVEVPANVDVDLHACAPISVGEGHDGQPVVTSHSNDPIDLGFLADVGPNSLHVLSFDRVVEPSIEAVATQAGSLRRIYLQDSELSDRALAVIARLTELRFFQSWGNRFTDEGVSQLSSLVNLRHLYLEEATLTLAAFSFVTHLPALEDLGVQDVPLTPDELEQLRQQLPNVRVGP